MNMDHHVVKKLSQNQHLGPRQRRETAKADDQCLARPKLHPAHSHVQDHVQAFFAFLTANHLMKLHFAIRVTVPYRSHIKLFDQHIRAESVEHSSWYDVAAFAISLLPTWAARFANLQPNIFTAIFSQKNGHAKVSKPNHLDSLPSQHDNEWVNLGQLQASDHKKNQCPRRQWWCGGYGQATAQSQTLPWLPREGSPPTGMQTRAAKKVYCLVVSESANYFTVTTHVSH